MLVLIACNGQAWTKRDIDATSAEKEWPCDEKFILECAVDDQSGRVVSIEGLYATFERFLTV